MSNWAEFLDGFLLDEGLRWFCLPRVLAWIALGVGNGPAAGEYGTFSKDYIVKQTQAVLKTTVTMIPTKNTRFKLADPAESRQNLENMGKILQENLTPKVLSDAWNFVVPQLCVC